MVFIYLFVSAVLLAQGWSQPSASSDPVIANNRMFWKSEDHLEPRVAGGTKVKDGDAPYMAAMMLTNGSQFCGATIVHEHWALTAAHCVIHDFEMHIEVGSVHRGKGEKHEVEKVVKHKFNKHTGDKDIALVKVKKPFVFNSKVSAAKLPTAEPTDGTKVQLFGFGKTEHGKSSPDLLTAFLSLLDRKKCQEMLKNKAKLTEGMICTLAKKGTASCPGDSGGPLMQGGNTLVGAVSFGVDESCLKGFPDVYANVHYYLPWIHENMK